MCFKRHINRAFTFHGPRSPAAYHRSYVKQMEQSAKAAAARRGVNLDMGGGDPKDSKKVCVFAKECSDCAARQLVPERQTCWFWFMRRRTFGGIWPGGERAHVRMGMPVGPVTSVG